MTYEIRRLITLLNEHTKYYQIGKPVISDQDWDKLYFRLKELEKETGIIYPDSPTQSITYTTQFNQDWNDFIHYFNNKDVVGMLKLDGLTCSLNYYNGQLIRAETRGDGEVGEDVTFNVKVISNVPIEIPYKEELILDGEIICTYSDFEEFKEDYANPRNFAAGSVRLLKSEESAKRKLKFVVWNVVKGPYDSVIDNFTFANKQGFTVVPWTSSFDWDAKEFLENEAKEFGYPIDGLVGRFNDIKYGESLGVTGHHSKAAFAFKYEDEKAKSRLLDIEWSMGRTGVLTPVAIFEPVELEGTTVERASLHNISIMRELLGYHPFKGMTVEIIKAHMITPQLVDGYPKLSKDITPEEKSIVSALKINNDNSFLCISETCPICGEPLSILESDSGVLTLNCVNEVCEGKLINRLDHFAGKKGLDIKGLSKATLEKLVEWEWVTKPVDLFTLHEHKEEWINKPGFGKKSVENILAAIENSKTTTLESFISAAGIPLIGLNVAKELVKYISSYEEFREKAENRFDFSQYHTFADSKTQCIWKFDFTPIDEVYPYIDIKINEEEKLDKTLEGKKIVITGSLKHFKNRDELKSEIEKRGGKVISSVSKNTDILINNNPSGTSSKNKTALSLNVPIISEDEFVETYM